MTGQLVTPPSDLGAKRAGLLGVAIGVLAVALSARLSVPVPGSSVPQSAQTLAVVLVGAWMGARGAAVTMTSYAVVGALGLPVFSDGSGWTHLLGPTGGYIVGFIVAGAGIGRFADAGLLRRPAAAFGVFVSGHVLILALGWAWLAASAGPRAAYESGVAPFVLGGIAKSAVATLLVIAWLRLSPSGNADLGRADGAAP